MAEPRPTDEREDEPATGRTDGSLLREIRSGDQDAAKELVDRYVGQLHRLANRQLARELSGRTDAHDVTQSIFRTLFRRLQEGQYSVPDGDTIWRLLVTIALNKIRAVGAYHRAGKRDVRKTAQVEEHRLSTPTRNGDEIALKELHLTIEEVIRQLTATQRQIVELRLVGLGVQEIATKTERSKRTVERTLQGFRHKLAQVLYEDG